MRKTAQAIVPAAVALLAAGGVQGQAWPDRPVKMVVAFPAGGNNDVIARIVAPQLSAAFGQQFIVENRPGASGIPGTEFVARSPADGHTLLLSSQPQIAIAPAMMKTPYDPAKDFVPIVNIGTNPFVFVVRAGLPVKTLGDFLAYVRARPKKLTYVATGVGSINHITTALLLKRTGGEMTPVFYKGGPAALLDLIAGRVDAYMMSVQFAVAHAKTGELKLLAVSSDHRLPQIPDVPTFAESGFADIKLQSWNGLLAPAGTPREIVDRIATETNELLKKPDLIKAFAKIGVDPAGGTPAEFATVIKDDIGFWREAIRITGVATVQE